MENAGAAGVKGLFSGIVKSGNAIWTTGMIHVLIAEIFKN